MRLHFLFGIFLAVQTALCGQTVLTPAQMQADLNVMQSTWEALHPGLYRYNTRYAIDAMFSAAHRFAAEPRSLRAFYVRLAQMNAQLHCGHSYVSYYNTPDAIKAELYASHVLPLLFQWMDDRLIITHGMGHAELTAGTEILAINGISVATIRDSLLTVSKGDGVHARNKQLDNMALRKRDVPAEDYALFDIYFPLFFMPDLEASEYTITYRKGMRKRSAVVNGVTKTEREKEYIQYHGALPRNEETWQLRELDTETALLRIGDLAVYNWDFDYAKFLQTAFAMIHQKGYRRLIVDIRENEGGSDEARDEILSYLTTRAIPCANEVRRLYRFNHVADSIKAHVYTWDESFLADKTDYIMTTDGFYESPDAQMMCDSIRPKPNAFGGDLYVITDVTNSSSTFIMAQSIFRYRLGTLVGQTTSGTQQGINGGQLVFLTLPHSGIEMDVPLIWQRPAATDAPDTGVAPDIAVYRSRRDIRKGTDAELKKVREMVNSR